MSTILISFSKKYTISAGLSLFVLFYGPVLADDKSSCLTVPFTVATVHYEHNVTDGDAEVVFEVKGGHDGLTKLSVVSPEGRTVINFSVPDPGTLGIRQFRFESPEPRHIQSLKAAYPEGIYTFTGATATGGNLYSQSRLSHRLSETATVLQPGNQAKGVIIENAEIIWTPVKHIVGCMIEIKADGTNLRLTAELPGSATAFALPPGFLMPGKEYELSLGTKTEEGNITFVESRFTTDQNN